MEDIVEVVALLASVIYQSLVCRYFGLHLKLGSEPWPRVRMMIGVGVIDIRSHTL